MEAEFAREILSRVPLAEAVLSLWRWVADPLFLLSVFTRHRGLGYEKEISFGVLVQLIADALLEHQGSGKKSFARGQEQGLLTASVQAVYQKLSRVPLGLSEAWLAESTARLRPVYPEAAWVPVAPALRDLEVIIVDGKAIKRVAKRLKPLRGRKGGVLGGKALVALELRRGVVVAMATHADGETNEARLVPALLPQVREHVSGRRLWVTKKASSATTEATPIATSSKPPSENSPNATPRLRTWTISSPGKTPSREPMSTLARMSAFVAWSTATTAMVSAAARAAAVPEINGSGRSGRR